LHIATKGNADLAGIGDITGTIEKGKDADIIITKDNPLDDLHTLRNVLMVMSRGKLIREPKVNRKAEVDEQLDKFC
jgi:imidazolonepropionase-like amidohydrolase